MRGIPHQGHATISPAIDRIAVIHTCNKGGVDLLHHLARTRLDVAKRALQLINVAALGPRLALDFSRRNRCENAVEVVWSKPVVDERGDRAQTSNFPFPPGGSSATCLPESTHATSGYSQNASVPCRVAA